MKRIASALAAVAVAILGTLALASPAMAATDPDPQVGTVTGSPDNGCPAWARDTFTRTTTITESETQGTYNIRQDIDGTWETGDQNKQGTIKGFVEYAVTGTLLGDLDAVDDDVDLSALDCKQNAPADSPDKTGNWALRYFAPEATAAPISNWEYVYSNACGESFTENDESEAMGADRFSDCPPKPEDKVDVVTEFDSSDCEEGKAKDKVTTTTTPYVWDAETGEWVLGEATVEVTNTERDATAEECPSAPTTTTTSAAPTLPVTGSGLTGLIAVAAVLVVAGAAVVVVARRRRA